MFQKVLKELVKDVSLPSYTNEFDTMTYILTALHSHNNRIKIKTMFGELETMTSGSHTREKLLEKSERYRQQGNQQYKGNSGNLVKVIQLYTKAIFEAPKDSEHLALAYANRGMALQAFGYYRQAYDDCACALAAGYPEKARVKIVMRQAHCALQMDDKARAQMHFAKLCDMQLNANFEKELENVRRGLEEIRTVEQAEVAETHFNPSMAQSKTYIKEIAGKGRGVVAKESLEKHALIFGDRAVAFVPVGEHKVCQHCAALQIIPLPCKNCNAIVYCSLQCQDAHREIHLLECDGYRVGFFRTIGLLHLAFRTVITLMPEIVRRLGDVPHAAAIWSELVPPLNILSDHVELSQTLSLVTHIDQMAATDVAHYATGVHVMVAYLRIYTGFFLLFDNTNAGPTEWELIVAALMLRTFGQLTVNASTRYALYTVNENFALLADGLWMRPEHLKRGQLNKFANSVPVFSAIYPFLSVCNHSCDASFELKYSGRYAWTYAMSAIKANEEICNGYTPGCRKASAEKRQRILSENFKFVCKCAKCTDVTEEYDEFIRQRCQYPECDKIFVPQIRYMHSMLEHGSFASIICTSCKRPQPYDLLDNVMKNLEGVTSEYGRKELFRSFDDLEAFYLGNSEIRASLATMIARICIRAHMDGSLLTAVEFEKLQKIIKLLLDITEKQSGLGSMNYVKFMTYLWDLYALGKLTIKQSAMDEMLNVGLMAVADELKVVFVNYYNDYLKPFVQ